MMLLHEAGLLAGQDESVLSDLYPVLWRKRLTYQGHEFLEMVRDTEVWRRTMAGGMITVPSRNDLAPRNPRIFSDWYNGLRLAMKLTIGCPV